MGIANMHNKQGGARHIKLCVTIDYLYTFKFKS